MRAGSKRLLSLINAVLVIYACSIEICGGILERKTENRIPNDPGENSLVKDTLMFECFMSVCKFPTSLAISECKEECTRYAHALSSRPQASDIGKRDFPPCRGLSCAFLSKAYKLKTHGKYHEEPPSVANPLANFVWDKSKRTHMSYSRDVQANDIDTSSPLAEFLNLLCIQFCIDIQELAIFNNCFRVICKSQLSTNTEERENIKLNKNYNDIDILDKHKIIMQKKWVSRVSCLEANCAHKKGKVAELFQCGLRHLCGDE